MFTSTYIRHALGEDRFLYSYIRKAKLGMWYLSGR
jgi:hypothetical protein